MRQSNIQSLSGWCGRPGLVSWHASVVASLAIARQQVMRCPP